NDFNKFGRTYSVQMQAEAPFRAQPEDLGSVYVRSSTTREMIPLKTLIRTSNVVGPEQLERFNGFLAAKVLGGGKPGVSSGEAIKAVEEVAESTLPEGYKIAWTGQAFQEKRTGRASAFAFSLAIVMVFLILAALYERWLLPRAARWGPAWSAGCSPRPSSRPCSCRCSSCWWRGGRRRAAWRRPLEAALGPVCARRLRGRARLPAPGCRAAGGLSRQKRRRRRRRAGRMVDALSRCDARGAGGGDACEQRRYPPCGSPGGRGRGGAAAGARRSFPGNHRWTAAQPHARELAHRAAAGGRLDAPGHAAFRLHQFRGRFVGAPGSSQRSGAREPARQPLRQRRRGPVAGQPDRADLLRLALPGCAARRAAGNHPHAARFGRAGARPARRGARFRARSLSGAGGAVRCAGAE